MINQSSGAGALFELIARGVKDKYFMKDDKTSHFPYDATYASSAHHLAERRLEIPVTRTQFGATFDVEINKYGDVLTECAFEIDLPTWLPPLPIDGQPRAPSIANGLFPITDAVSGASYGYVNYVGYYLFEKIQFYQDQFLIQEWSGDGLLAHEMSSGSWNSSFLRQMEGGLVSGQPQGQTDIRAIQLRATPGHLRIKLPLPGMQCPGDGGFPLAALPWQTFHIKGTLRRLEDLVVCSDPTVYKPAPWFIPQFTYTTPSGVNTFAPKELVDIGQPIITLSTIQHYVPPTIQEELRSKPIQIPFRKWFENQFTFGELDYISLDKGGVSAITRRIDGRHPTERLFWFFRNQNQLDQNRLDSFYNDYFDSHPVTAQMLQTQPYTMPYGEFYYRLKLMIAGKEREDSHEPFVWNQLTQFAKNEKANGKQIGSMVWSTGDNYGTVYPAEREPEGTINLSTADRPTLYIELANITSNTVLAQRRAEMRLYTEGWNVYEVKEGRGRVLFAS
jgi:hypothetical protein